MIKIIWWKLKKDPQFSNLELVLFGQVENPDLPEGVIYYHNPKQEDIKQIYQSLGSSPRRDGALAVMVSHNINLY